MSLTREEKLEKIDEIIREFSEQSTKLIDEKAEKYDKIFREIYTEDFRHEYSRIFLQLSIIRNKKPQAIDVVAENLRHFVETQERNECPYISCLMKLFDHVSLDVARMNYMTAAFGEQESKLQEYSKNLLDKTEIQIESEITGLKRKTGKMQREYVAILGIFASIIVTFMAGMLFDSSVLDNIGKVSVYRLTGISLMIGLITFDLLYILLGFIYKMTREDGIKGMPFKCSFWIVHIVFIAAAVIVLCAWSHGCIEQRNVEILNMLSTMKSK